MALHSKNTTTANTRPRRGIGSRGVTVAGLLAVGALTASVAIPAAASAAVTRPASLAHNATATQTNGTGGGVKQFGMADPDLLGESASAQAAQLTAMRAIGITEIRLDANWDYVQYGGQNTFDWSQLDQAVASVRAAGMSVDLIVDGCPPWAAVSGTSGDDSPQPASSAQYARWAAEVAARYAPKGVNMFEIWNEPNNGHVPLEQEILHNRVVGRHR